MSLFVQKETFKDLPGSIKSAVVYIKQELGVNVDGLPKARC
jgi:hypothetical protein